MIANFVQFFLIDYLEATGWIFMIVCLLLKVAAHRSGAFR
jgi:hypothetical protein